MSSDSVVEKLDHERFCKNLLRLVGTPFVDTRLALAATQEQDSPFNAFDGNCLNRFLLGHAQKLRDQPKDGNSNKQKVHFGFQLDGASALGSETFPIRTLDRLTHATS